jgi:RIO-like serine/threonine protein kinase
VFERLVTECEIVEAQGVVHKDMKPTNIVFTKRPKQALVCWHIFDKADETKSRFKP